MDTIYELAQALMVWKQSIYFAISYKLRFKNCYWSYSNSIDITKYSNPNNSRKVYKYNKEGKCVAIYNSIGIAAKENNTKPAHIIQRVNTGMFSENEYYYSYELFDTYIPKQCLDLKNKEVFLYDLNGNYIIKVSVKELKKEYKIHTYKEISNIILNKLTLLKNQIRLEYIEPYTPKK